MKPISNITYQIQYLTIFFILDLQENIYKKVQKTYYMLAGGACSLLQTGDHRAFAMLAAVSDLKNCRLYQPRGTYGSAVRAHSQISFQTADQSGCWENGFSADFLEYLYFIPEMKPISNIAYQIQYLTIFFIWTSRKISIKKSRKSTTCRPASPANMQWILGT